MIYSAFLLRLQRLLVIMREHGFKMSTDFDQLGSFVEKVHTRADRPAIQRDDATSKTWGRALADNRMAKSSDSYSGVLGPACKGKIGGSLPP